jgi:hypothetical protein
MNTVCSITKTAPVRKRIETLPLKELRDVKGIDSISHNIHGPFSQHLPSQKRDISPNDFPISEALD